MTTKYPVNSDYCANHNTIGEHRTAHCAAIVDVPLPPGAVLARDWDYGHRIFEGEQRELAQDSTDKPIEVWAFGYQAADGRIVDLAAGISVAGLCWEEPLSAATARKLADVLVTAADEVERWAR